MVSVNSTALRARWGVPDDANGILQGYQLSLELVPEDAAYLGNYTATFNLDEDTLSLVVNMLHPFATYRLTVRAETSAGLGNQTMRMATTNQDGKLGLQTRSQSHSCLRSTVIVSGMLQDSGEMDCLL